MDITIPESTELHLEVRGRQLIKTLREIYCSREITLTWRGYEINFGRNFGNSDYTIGTVGLVMTSANLMPSYHCPSVGVYPLRKDAAQLCKCALTEFRRKASLKLANKSTWNKRLYVVKNFKAIHTNFKSFPPRRGWTAHISEDLRCGADMKLIELFWPASNNQVESNPPFTRATRIIVSEWSKRGGVMCLGF